MTKSVEKCKEDIANKYLDDFKKELNLLERLMVLPINRKMKEILKSKKKIDVDNLSELEDLGFWRKILGVKIGDKQLFEHLISKVFSFLKEKQEKIIQAQAAGNLEKLLDSIINGRIDNLSHGVDSSDGSESQDGDSGEGGSVEDGGSQDGDSGEGGSVEDEGSQDGDSGEGGNVEDEGSQDGAGGEGGSVEDEGSQDGAGGEGGNDGSQGLESQDGGVNPIVAGVISGAGGGAAYYEGISYAERRLGINRLREVPKEFDSEQTKKMMQNIRNQMNERLESGDVKMNRVQKRTYKKSVKEFDKALESFDSETVDAFKERQKISDRVPPDFLKNLSIDRKILNMIDAIPDDELLKIVGMDEKNIVKFFKNKGIDISEDFAKQLKIVRNVGEIKQITKIARCGTRISNLVKGIKGMGLVSFLFAGFDVWCYFDSKSDAELAEKINEMRGQVLKDQAQMQLIIGLGSVGLELLTIIITCVAGGSMTGPWGTIVGVVVGIIAAAASILYDRLYADKKAFYAQNRYDFINQTRTGIKQSIVQLLESDRLDMHESMKGSIKDSRGINSEIDTMEDAREALIFQEECLEGDFELLKRYYGSGEKEEVFVNKLDDNQKEKYNEEKSHMENLISLRMEYIKNYIKEDKHSPEYKKMKEVLENKGGLLYIEQLLADSKVYSYVKQDHEDCYVDNYKNMDVESYKIAYREKLSNEYPKEFSKFEELCRDNEGYIREICEGVEAYKFSIEGYFQEIEDGVEGEDMQLYTTSETETIKRNMDFILKYREYKLLGLPFNKKPPVRSYDSFDYSYIENILLDLNEIDKRPQRAQENTLHYLSGVEYINRDKDIDSLVSNSIFQNILYSIAKEVHGYTGNNDKLELIQFYAGDGNTLGIYMDGKRRINEDWRIDGTIDNPNSLNKDNILKKIVDKMELDSVVECADDSLNVEYRKTVTDIVNREFEFIENKAKYEEKIINYINSHAIDGNSGYIELPQTLVIEGMKAGIGNIHQFLFRVENGEIHALCRGDVSERVLNFDKTNKKIKFESTKKLRDLYSDEEKNLISMVDEIESKLLLIRGVEGDDLKHTKDDELDIPVELERLLSKKSAEWDAIKESILYMLPQTAHDYLKENAQNYYDYFNGIYIGILTRVTGRKNYATNSNDIDDIEDFFSFFSPIGEKVAYKENNEIKLGGFVNEKIGKYMLKIFDLYADANTGKTIKELLLSDEPSEETLGQELSLELYKLCLEETTFQYAHGKLVDFSIRDMNDAIFEKVKEKIYDIFSKKKFYIVFDEYVSSDAVDVMDPPQTRVIGYGEYYLHRQVELVTEKIISTMNNIDWAGKRKDPEFVADETQIDNGKVTGVFKSRGYSEKIEVETQSNGDLSINIQGLNQRFTDIEEGIRVANIINFIKNNIKEEPEGSGARGGLGTLGRYMWYKGALDRDVKGAAEWFNYTIIKKDTVNTYYPSIRNSTKFINYINGLFE